MFFLIVPTWSLPNCADKDSQQPRNCEGRECDQQWAELGCPALTYSRPKIDAKAARIVGVIAATVGLPMVHCQSFPKGALRAGLFAGNSTKSLQNFAWAQCDLNAAHTSKWVCALLLISVGVDDATGFHCCRQLGQDCSNINSLPIVTPGQLLDDGRAPLSRCRTLGAGENPFGSG